MVPRTDVVVLSIKRTIEENLDIIRTTRHTRYPLCDGTLDKTIGLIHVKDLLLAQLRGPGRTLMELKRDVLFIPENSTVDAVLSQFIEHKTHMAVVLDEYGGASGIVSLENITEELFGQIQDEFDRERPEIEPLGNGRYRVRGDYLIEDLADRLKVDVGEPAEETIGGYVAAKIEREVAPGDRVQLGDLSIQVIEAERFRVRWVIVQTQMPKTEVIEETEAWLSRREECKAADTAPPATLRVGRARRWAVVRCHASPPRGLDLAPQSSAVSFQIRNRLPEGDCLRAKYATTPASASSATIPAIHVRV